MGNIGVVVAASGVAIWMAIAAGEAEAGSLEFTGSPEVLPHILLKQGGKPSSQELPPAQAEAERLFTLGNQQFQDRQYEAALESWQQAAELYRQGGDRQQEGRVWGNIGAVYQGLGQPQQAITYFQRSLEAARSVNDATGQIYALDNLGFVYRNLGQYNQALEVQQQALALAQQQGDRLSQRHSLNSLGLIYKAQGQYDAALEYLQQALTLAQNLNDEAGLAEVLGNLGNVHAERGAYPEALAYYDDGLALMQSLGDRRGEAIVLQRLGNVYLDINQLSAAAEQYETSLEMARQVRDLSLEAYTLGNLAVVAREQGDIDRALSLLNTTLTLLQQLGDRPKQAITYTILGNTHLEQGNLDAAQTAYGESLNLARQLGDRSTEAIALGNLGLVADQRGEATPALQLYQQSLALAEQTGDRLRQGQALNNLGGLYYDQFGDLEQAAAALTAAVEIWESLRPGLSDDQQISLFETQAHTYRLLQRVLIELNQPTKALEVAERGRARAFVELVATRLSATTATQFQTEPLTVDEMRAVAEKQEATLVQYSVLNEFQVAIWVIQPTGAIDLRLAQLDSEASVPELAESTRVAAALGRSLPPRRSPVVQQVEAIQAAVRSGSSMDTNRMAPAQLRSLHQLLIQPIADLLPDDPEVPVVILPHEELYLVPFAALQDEAGRYLIERHTLMSSPSIQVLALQQARQRTAADETEITRTETAKLVVGNPVMPSIGTPPQPLTDLPNAETEARTIAQLLDTTATLGAIATEPYVTAEMGTASIIHLATHGLLDDVEALGIPGAIALAPTATADGLLTAGEILELNLRADLVVLSACNTGRGRITGDGVVGLSRTLMSAGAESVVVSLWAVPDAPTAELMTEFYRFLQQGMGKPQALRQAMLSTLETYPSSRDWGAFVLMGD